MPNQVTDKCPACGGRGFIERAHGLLQIECGECKVIETNVTQEPIAREILEVLPQKPKKVKRHRRGATRGKAG